MKIDNDLFGGLTRGILRQAKWQSRKEVEPVVSKMAGLAAFLLENQLHILNHIHANLEHRTDEDDKRIRDTTTALEAAKKQLAVVTCEHNKNIDLIDLKDGILTCKRGCGLNEKLDDEDAELMKAALAEALMTLE